MILRKRLAGIIIATTALGGSVWTGYHYFSKPQEVQSSVPAKKLEEIAHFQKYFKEKSEEKIKNFKDFFKKDESAGSNTRSFVNF